MREDKPLKEIIRKERVPLGSPKSRMRVPDRAGYHRRWMNDTLDRIARALDGGWKFVEDPNIRVGEREGNTDTGSKISMVVGRDKSGNAMRAYLMEIELDLWKSDQRDKQKQLDEIDLAIKQGTLRPSDNQYVPDDGRGINITST